MLVSARVWQPTVLTSEFVGPLTIAEPGQAATISANWRHAQTQVHGLPTSPESVSIKIEQLVVDRATAARSCSRRRARSRRPHDVRHGQRQSGDRDGAEARPPPRRRTWHPAAGDSGQRRHHRGAARAEGFCAASPGRSGCANCRPQAAASRSRARGCSRATRSPMASGTLGLSRRPARRRA